MESLEILVISTNADTLEVVLRLVNKQENWTGIGASTPEQAREAFDQAHYDLVLFCVSFTADIEAALVKHFVERKPEVVLIQHYGGGSGLLYNEIRAALDSGVRGKMIDEAHPSN